MSKTWPKALKNSPKIDCGLCSRGTCNNFVRAFLTGFVKIEECPILKLEYYREARERLEEFKISEDTIHQKASPEISEEGVLFTKPCSNDDQKVMAELRIINGVPSGEPMRYPLFDASLFCSLLECLTSLFDKVRCSGYLGYGRAEIGEMSTTLLNDGRINMRRVNDRDEVMLLFNKLERILLGSVVCDCCGSDLLSILTHSLSPLSANEHTIYNAGVSFSLDRDSLLSRVTSDEFMKVYGEESQTVLSQLNEVYNDIVWEIERLIAGQPRLHAEFPDISPIRCKVSELLLDEKSIGVEHVGIRVLGLLQAIENGIKGLQAIVELFDESEMEFQDWILEVIEPLRGGRLYLKHPSVDNPRRLLLFAHSKRVQHAITNLQSWSF